MPKFFCGIFYPDLAPIRRNMENFIWIESNKSLNQNSSFKPYLFQTL